MPRILVAVVALLLAAPLHASFELGQPRLGPADRVWGSLVAANAHGFLALWNHGTQADVAATPIDANGRSTAASGVGFDRSPAQINAIVPFGDGFLVQSLEFFQGEARSRFVTVSSDGRTQSPWNAASPVGGYLLSAATPRGDRVLLFPLDWNDRRAVIVDRGGALVGTVTIPFPRGGPKNRLSIASDDESFVFAWADNAGLYVQRIPADGGAPGPVITVTNGAPSVERVSAAVSGSDLLVVYAVSPSDPQTAMRIAHVSREGAVTFNESFRVPPGWEHDSATLFSWDFTLRAASDHFVLIAPDMATDTLSAIRLDARGTALDSTPVVVHVPRASGQIANRGDRFYITGLDQFGETQGIIGSTFLSTGGIHDVRHELLSVAFADQRSPVTATDGSAVLTVWDDHLLNDSELRGTIFLSGGQKLASFRLRAAPYTWLHGVAHARGVFAILWRDQDELRVSRVLVDGTVLDPQPIPVPASLKPFEAKIVSNGESFLVAWTTYTGRVFAARLSAGGSLGPAREMRKGPPPAAGFDLVVEDLHVASDGQDFLVLWTAIDKRGVDWIQYGDIRTEAVIVRESGLPTSTEAVRVAEGRGGPVVWNGARYVYAAPAVEGVVLHEIDRSAHPMGSSRALDLPGHFETKGVVLSRGEIVIGYDAKLPLGGIAHRVARIGPAVQRFSFGNSADAGQNLQFAIAGGGLLAVMDEYRPGAEGARSLRAVVYREEEFVPIVGKRAVTRH